MRVPLQGLEKVSDKNTACSKKLQNFLKEGRMTLVKGNKDSKNMAILGDNLISLQSLKQGSPCKDTALKADIIYIDPPYNVGGIQGYKNKWKGNSDRHAWAGESGAYIEFMEPRLKASHALLNEEGVIFVSICDGEYHRLKVLMDSIFGPKNYLGTIVWDKKVGAATKYLVATHEYIIIYAKDIKKTPLLEKEKPGAFLVIEKALELKESGVPYKEAQKQFTQWINEAKRKGKITSGEAYFCLLHPKSFRPFRGNCAGMQCKSRIPLDTDLPHPVTGKPCKVPKGGWKWSEAKFKKLTAYEEVLFGQNFVIAGEFYYGKDETTIPRKLSYLDEHIKQTPRSVLYVPCSGFKDLPDGLKFLTPKPLALIKEIISYYPKKDAVVVDYFAGSAATAQAVHELNNEDKGTRSWIVIEAMKSTFDEVIVPRLGHFDKEEDFGTYEMQTLSGDLYSKEAHDFIYEKTGDLPAEERKLIYLLFWKGFTEKEVSLFLGLKLSEIEGLKEKAFSTLRNLYQKEFLDKKVLPFNQDRRRTPQKDNLACT